MSSSLTRLTLAQALYGLRKKDFSAQELCHSYLEAIDHSSSNAYILATPELASQQAKSADQRISRGDMLPLDGVPLGIKDNFCTKGVQTTSASRMLQGFVPPYESTVTKKLWAAGAIMLGKTNLDEFAMGSSNVTSFFGPVINPWRSSDASDQDLVPGGSSGGSAAAVAGGLAIAALGTDTGGSIRQPAAFCGLVGLKPTYGRCSRWGIVAFASSLDQPGPMCRTVEDVALMLNVMAGYDSADSTSARVPVPDFTKELASFDLSGMRIGIPREYELPGMDAQLVQFWEQGQSWLRAAGAQTRSVSLPHTRFALATYYVLASAEAASNLARYDGVRFGYRMEGQTIDQMYENTRSSGFGKEVRRRIMIGTYVLSQGHYTAFYQKAQKVRQLIAQDFRNAFQDVDLILTPSAPTGAFPVGENMQDPVAMYLNDVFTVPVNLAGLPAMTVPCHLNAKGLPLGLQLIGRKFEESRLLQGAAVLEKSALFPALPF